MWPMCFPSKDEGLAGPVLVGVSRALVPSLQRCESSVPASSPTQCFSPWAAHGNPLRSSDGVRVGAKKAKPIESESSQGKCDFFKAPREFGGATRIENPLRHLSFLSQPYFPLSDTRYICTVLCTVKIVQTDRIVPCGS